MEHGAQSRTKLRDDIALRVVNHQTDIDRGLQSAGLRSKGEVDGWELEGNAQSVEDGIKGGADPFAAWPRLLALWAKFQAREQQPTAQS